jgi:hypothetical protein
MFVCVCVHRVLIVEMTRVVEWRMYAEEASIHMYSLYVCMQRRRGHTLVAKGLVR